MYTGRLVFATGNPNKIKEANRLLGDDLDIIGLKDIGCAEELPETHDTLDENSLEKASYVFEQYKSNCFAEDTGLEVTALNGEPGVYSARYAGPDKIDRDNIALLLDRLEGKEDMSARFRTVITLIIDGVVHQFEGIIEGVILDKPTGTEGFGYDPIFMPRGYDRSFAQMDIAEKSPISHRGKAVKKLVNFLEHYSHKNNE